MGLLSSVHKGTDKVIMSGVAAQIGKPYIALGTGGGQYLMSIVKTVVTGRLVTPRLS